LLRPRNSLGKCYKDTLFHIAFQVGYLKY